MHRVKVAVRVNPCSPTSDADRESADKSKAEADSDERKVEITPEKNCITVRRGRSAADEFYFDAVFPGHAAQKSIYQQIAAPVVQAFLDGSVGVELAWVGKERKKERKYRETRRKRLVILVM